jgi:hypothetical protein
MLAQASAQAALDAKPAASGKQAKGSSGTVAEKPPGPLPKPAGTALKFGSTSAKQQAPVKPKFESTSSSSDDDTSSSSEPPPPLEEDDEEIDPNAIYL